MVQSAISKYNRAIFLFERWKKIKKHYFDTNIFLTFKNTKNGSDLDIFFQVKEHLIPLDFLSYGNILNNLKGTLDHLVWELIEIDNGITDDTLYFPIGRDQEQYDKKCDKIDTPSTNIKDFLKKFELFPNGKGEIICEINKLLNYDKHRNHLQFRMAIDLKQIQGITIINNCDISPEKFLYVNESNKKEQVIGSIPSEKVANNHLNYEGTVLVKEDTNNSDYKNAEEIIISASSKIQEIICDVISFRKARA
ncbi:MAG: hypothetical protein H6855_01515 [Rhodospirillales bacterium]|nr:hypothetical protein [Rhodospirillales bacterium]